MDLFQKLNEEFLKCQKNNFKNNYDFYRFGKLNSLKNQIKGIVQSLVLRKKNNQAIVNNQALLDIFNNSSGLQSTYDSLSDDRSKSLLVQLLLFRLLGNSKVKLPLSNPDFWDNMKGIQKLQAPGQTIKPKFFHINLHKYNLEKIGYPIQLYLMPLGIMADFVSKQYEYPNNTHPVRANEGDIVIDAGGCWGDTALYFANEVGPSGEVHTFEFIPSNIEIFKKNIALNPTLEQQIHLCPQPLWSTTGDTFYYQDKGPASSVSNELIGNDKSVVQTITIDDYADQKGLKKVDFIKMDIEGAELEALKGSERTLKKHRPKLAISVYHKLEDFVSIPEYLNSLNLNYRFYLGHYTIHSEETILFCE